MLVWAKMGSWANGLRYIYPESLAKSLFSIGGELDSFLNDNYPNQVQNLFLELDKKFAEYELPRH